MDSNKQSELIVNKVKELHTNVRHITQLGMNWFAFFVTVNYVTMSWLAKGPSNETQIDSAIVWRIAFVFIVQNFLGILGLTWVLVAARAMKVQVSKFENSNSYADNEPQAEGLKSESIPIALYIAIGVFLILVLISLIWAWISVYYRFK
jgi:hypothetical protein